MKMNGFWHRLSMAAYALSIILMLPLALAGCSKDDDNDPDQTGNPTEKASDEADLKGSSQNTPEAGEVPEGEDVNENHTAIRGSLKTALVMNSLCWVDTVPETGLVTYTPCIGEAIYTTSPTVYYAIANNEAHAEAIYQSIVSPLQDNDKEEAMPHDVTQDDIHLSYTKGTANGELGRIIVDCPRLRNILSTVVFLKEDAWPKNDVASPCNYLSVWKEVKTGYYYVCIREAKGNTGVLMTFDGGWGEDWFKDSYWQNDFSTWTNCALQDHFETLVGSMKYSETKFKNMLKKLEEVAGRENKTWDLLDDMFNYPTRKRVFDCDYSYKKGRWWFKYNYYITVKYVEIENKTCTKKSCYNEHCTWPVKARPSYYKTFTQANASEYKDANKWQAVYR